MASRPWRASSLPRSCRKKAHLLVAGGDRSDRGPVKTKWAMKKALVVLGIYWGLYPPSYVRIIRGSLYWTSSIMESKTIFFVVQISTKVPGCWHLRCLHKKMGCRWPFWGKWRPLKWHFEFWVLKFELLDDFVRRILPTMRWVPSLHQHCDRKICFSKYQKKQISLKFHHCWAKVVRSFHC